MSVLLWILWEVLKLLLIGYSVGVGWWAYGFERDMQDEGVVMSWRTYALAWAGAALWPLWWADGVQARHRRKVKLSNNR